MKYYSIRHSLNKKETGNYQQVEEAQHNCNVWDDPLFIDYDQNFFKKLDFSPITSNAILKKGSKLTDFISAPIMGFTKKLLVSGKLKQILESSRKSGMQFFKSPVYYKNKLINDYWVLNMYEINMDMIDFKKSVIFKTNYFDNLMELDVKNVFEFKKYKEEIEKEGYPNGISIEKIKIRADKIMDFFALLDVEGGVKYMVSEKLKKEIETAQCTGIEFMPIGISLNEWLTTEREKIYGKA
ncbi:imm11 family protein [Tenacibaculum sp. IMCC1]|uniref:Immunity MXAN-0049 protein domain-containing protein n=1 Tax=Tenacibaculum sp. Pbs-1 TaxID=3238748 RepID=A0AB33L061_9FLAO